MKERLFRIFVNAFVLGMFALPIAGIIVHAAALQQAERDFQAQQKAHRIVMEKMIAEYNARKR